MTTRETIEGIKRSMPHCWRCSGGERLVVHPFGSICPIEERENKEREEEKSKWKYCPHCGGKLGAN